MIPTPARYFKNLPIRLKLFYACTFILVIFVLLAGVGVYVQASSRIEKNIETELSNATNSILRMVATTAESSIKNYLRATAEKNLQIVASFHDRVLKGEFSTAAAQHKLRQILFAQTIGRTGYIFCLDSDGKAVMHPNPGVEGDNFKEFDFIREQIKRKQGYLEYMWKNPGEKDARAKAMYMAYFEPWDWIISISSYRSEFSALINIEDFKDNILSQTFGRTGYSYVLASNGEVVIHPHLSGNVWDIRDDNGRYLVREQCRTKSGKLHYAWRNPGENIFREKVVIYNYIPEYDWIVASTGYIEEFYAPLRSARSLAVTTMLVIICLVLPTTFFMARGITRPLKALEKKLSQGMAGNFTGRVQVEAGDEIGNLAAYFNQFMDKLESSNRKIADETRERKRTEELFSKAFHASPSGIFILNLENNRFIRANESFLTFLSAEQEEILQQPADELPVFGQSPGMGRIIDRVRKKGQIQALDVEFVTRDGEVRLGTVNGETVHIWGHKCLLCAVEDQTETRQLEREIIDISERERLQLGQYLHDDLSSHLMGIDFMHKVLLKKLVREGSRHLSSVEEMRALIQEAMAKTSRISRGLCPTQIAGREPDLALRELCRDIEDVYDVSCRLDTGSRPIRLDTRKAVHIYYIAREAAYNAVKHGGAANIRIRMRRNNTSGVVEIDDDGCGFDTTAQARGMGLKIMAYRARRIGAGLEINSVVGAGTRCVLAFHPDDNIMERQVPG